MERKIGEIFKYNGEWYQCIIGHFNQCFFDEAGTCKFIGDPYCAYRNDKKLACFQKLEKVGEPYVAYGKVRQKYKLHVPLTITNGIIDKDISCDDVNGIVDIEIKQNKEDMEEKKIQHYDCFFNRKPSESNLKPFSLELAKQGKPVCTRDGRKARIICFDKGGEQPIVALIEKNEEESIDTFFSNGHSVSKTNEVPGDLMMLPEKKEGWVNVYKNQIHNTFESAEEGHKGTTDYIKTIKVEWEE